MRVIIRSCIFLFSLLLLSGCTSGELIKNNASETVSAGHKAIDLSSQYFDGLLLLQEKNAELVYITQPDCIPNEDNIIHYKLEQTTGRSDLCASGNDKFKPLSLTPLKKSHFSADELMMKSFSDYLDALSAKLSDPKTPVSDLLDKALANAKVASMLSAKADLGKEQLTAIHNLSNFLEHLIKVEKQGKEITTLVKSHGAEQIENMNAIKKDIDNMNQLYVDAMKQTNTGLLVNYYRKNVKSGEFSTLNQRQSFFRENDIVANEIQYSKENTPPASEAISQFIQYHEHLLKIVDGNLTDEERKEQSKMARDNLLIGLKYVGEVAKPLIFALAIAV